MNSDVFTAGIEQGGLTTDYEIRMLVCWLLERLKKPITFGQLNYALQQEGLVNYFELSRAVGDLLKSGHLTKTEEDTIESAKMAVTDLGRETSITFEKNLPLTVREKALSSAKDSLLRQRLEKENRVSIEETPDGFRMVMTMSDFRSDLMSLTIYLPTREICEGIKRRFLNDPTVLYRVILGTLTGEEIEITSLSEEI